MDTRLIWLALGAFAGVTESFAITALLPGIAEELGVSFGVAGLAVFAYALAYGIFTPVLSATFGNVERRKLLAGAELTVGLAALLIAVAPSFPILVAFRVLLALGAGLFTSMALATAIAMTPPERRARSLSIVIAGQSLAVLLGVPLSAFLVVHTGWRPVYALVGLLALSAAAALFLALPNGIGGERRGLMERLRAIQVPGVKLVLAVSALIMIAVYLPMVFVVPLAAALGGLGRDVLPLVLIANGVGAVIGGNLGGRLSDRFGPVPVMATLALAQAVLLGLTVALPMLGDGLRGWGFGLAIGLFGLIGWGFWPALNSHLARVADRATPLAISLNLTAMNIGVALASVTGGYLVDHRGTELLPLVGIPFALLVAALLLTAPRVRAPAV